MHPGAELEKVKRDIGSGKEILLILDGLDELPDNLLESSIFIDLLSGKVLGDATILVTSRPSATRPLFQHWSERISKHFVICGFNEGDIKEYAKSILSDTEQLTVFQKCLTIHPRIQSIMYVPLHSAIVMAVYSRCNRLPNTVTELYTWLVNEIFSQYVKDQPNREDKVLPEIVHTHFRKLSKLAFEKLCDQRLTFSDMPKDLHDIGFTDSVPELVLSGTASCSYNFLHLSIQEFLAAYHVSRCLLMQEQEQLLHRSRKKHHLQNMMKFVAGITKFEEFDEKEVKKVLAVERKQSQNDLVNPLSHVNYLDNYSLELLYECQSVSYLCKEDTYSDLGWHSQAHWLALGYCIANSNCTWMLELDHMNAVDVQMLVKGLRDFPSTTQPAYTISNIEWRQKRSGDEHSETPSHIDDTYIFTEQDNLRAFSDEVDSSLLKQAPLYFTTHMEHMCISKPILSHAGQDDLTNFCVWLPTCQLKTLTLPPLEPHNIEMVSRALVEVSTLKTLEMKGSKFTLRSMEAFASIFLNQSLTSVDISENCDINECSLDSDCARCLARALYNNRTLTMLDLCIDLGERGALEIAEKLKYNSTLRLLNMTEDSIGERGAQAMEYNATRTVLNMGEMGAQEMAEMLLHNKTLKSLRMYSHTIGVEGAMALVNSLAKNHHLRELHISDKYKKEVEALPAYQNNKERVYMSEV